MMSLRDFFITLAVIISLLSSAISFECPEFCACTVSEDGGLVQNHAKCSSLEGLKAEVKHIPLHTLDLSNANVSKIATHLEKFRDLVSLDLSYNQLSEVGRLGRRIKDLNLSHNKITSGKLSKLPTYVESLDLSHNEITYLPLDLKKLHSLKSIELTGNTINCTCETLDVRNWLQANRVWTDNHIQCSYPLAVKGMPWLHVRQSELCTEQEVPRSIPLKQELTSDDDNELMLGDQPIVDEGSGQGIDDELEKDFLPVDEKSSKKPDDSIDINAEEGSGDIFEEVEANGTHVPTANPVAANVVDGVPPEIGSGGNELEDDEQGRLMENDDEGSGSGMLPFIPRIHLDTDESTPLGEHNGDDNDENTPVAPPQEESTNSPTDIFGAGLGIMQPNEESTNSAVVEEQIVAIKAPSVESQPTADEVDGPVKKNENMMAGETDSYKEANTGASKSTYILLGVVLLLLIVLIVFVAVKRRNANRRRRSDVENPRSTELIDMNKKNLGKGLNKNGTPEQKPLIGDRATDDLAKPISGNKQTPYDPAVDKDTKAQQPLLQNAPTRPESNNNVSAPNRDIADGKMPAQNIEPVHKPTQNGPSSMDNPASDDEVFLPTTSNPSSPKASRYSPVYEPETGRVKIKLLETPKPKTPLLVTRTRSNAGEIITTPNGNSLHQTDDTVH